jgi:hypothetical protein
VSETRAALKSLAVAIRRHSDARALLTAPQMPAALNRLTQTPQEPKPPSDMLEEARRKLIAAADGPGVAAGTTRRDRRHAPWLLWTGKRPLIALRGLLPAVYSDAEGSTIVFSRLLEAWIAACDPEMTGIAESGLWLAQTLARSREQRFDFWRAAQSRFDFFDARIGPSRVAKAILAESDGVAAALKAAGLNEEARASSGYARQTQRRLLDELGSELASPRGEAALARAREFLAMRTTLRFEDERPGLAQGLLAPWRSGRPPGEAVRKGVQDFLLRHLGDPRISSRWSGVDEASRAILRGWLARAHLKLFFEVVADNAEDSFKFRRAFWTAALEAAQKAGLHCDVWLALGRHTHAQASGVAELRNAFARLKGAQGNQSVFLMQIKDTVFCEWSHSGSVRAWRADWRGYPRLEQSEYERGELMRSGLEFPKNPLTQRGGSTSGEGLSHYGGSGGNWQGCVAELLRRNCGLIVKDYMP